MNSDLKLKPYSIWIMELNFQHKTVKFLEKNGRKSLGSRAKSAMYKRKIYNK